MSLHTHPNNYPNQFIVKKKQVSKNKTLKTSILYDKIESNVNYSLDRYQKATNLSFKSVDFDFYKNAFLNDKLFIKNNTEKLSATELIMKITVTKNEEKKQNIICEATFGYYIKETS